MTHLIAPSQQGAFAHEAHLFTYPLYIYFLLTSGDDLSEQSPPQGYHLITPD
jgi:hypothetical protein